MLVCYAVLDPRFASFAPDLAVSNEKPLALPASFRGTMVLSCPPRPATRAPIAREIVNVSTKEVSAADSNRSRCLAFPDSRVGAIGAADRHFVISSRTATTWHRCRNRPYLPRLNSGRFWVDSKLWGQFRYHFFLGGNTGGRCDGDSLPLRCGCLSNGVNSRFLVSRSGDLALG